MSLRAAATFSGLSITSTLTRHSVCCLDGLMFARRFCWRLGILVCKTLKQRNFTNHGQVSRRS